MDVRILATGTGSTSWTLIVGEEVYFGLFDGSTGATGDLQSFLKETLGRVLLSNHWHQAAARLLFERFTATDGPLPAEMAMAAAIGMVTPSRLAIAWAGDVRVHAKHNHNVRYTTLEHTVAAEGAKAGMELPGNPNIYRSALTRAFGRLPSPPPEIYEIGLPLRSEILVCTRATHQYESPDIYADSTFNRAMMHGQAVLSNNETVHQPSGVIAIQTG